MPKLAERDGGSDDPFLQWLARLDGPGRRAGGRGVPGQ